MKAAPVALLSDVRLLTGALRAARPPLTSALTVLLVAGALLPPASALAMAHLVGQIQTTGQLGAPLSAVVLPLLAFVLVLLAGHVVDTAVTPLATLATARIDGAHRARVAGLAAGTTIAALEDPEVRAMIRAARADPENWTEHTPGAGAVAGLRLAASLTGVAGSCLVLAAYAGWLVPALLLPALINGMFRQRDAARGIAIWRSGTIDGARNQRWLAVATSPAEGKDIRIYGLGDWLTRRIQRHALAMDGPVWAALARAIPREAGQLLLIGVPLVAGYATVAAGAAGAAGAPAGSDRVVAATAVLASGVTIFQTLGWSEDLRVAVAATGCLRATEDLADRLPVPSTTSEPTARATPPPPAPEPALAGPPLVRFEQVSFGYPGARRPVLDRLDLEIRPGELLAIVGLNGAGKSTLIKILAGLYQPDAGRVTADGVDVTALGPVAWRHRLAIVFQDFVRYHLPARDNVALGRGDRPFDPTVLDAAAADAGLDPVLARLPAGWATPLARTVPGGVDLSGGQWQQIALARARYAVRMGADLLVLDEPTAHLDVRTEFEVFHRLAAVRGGVSVVLISHRLSTVRQADRIVLLDGGRITESGHHDELIACQGRYAELFAIQARRFTSGAHG
ncbi:MULTISPECIES: ATP-binding cassette domain-containing protein [unclassified Solwaraspora]|uniref:ATP-binding cassette domain-containing protein n=1 Tax=unclassified Solwaraspora TaxID=2627926 RepID=UPI00259BCF86|nr:ABC transporter ATP-binding protein [Solwaraspora sp. WMMA2056]WJK44198.1 ABC transporter ATP-binding protein [Solwaraspora sp. WMMA2056]